METPSESASELESNWSKVLIRKKSLSASDSWQDILQLELKENKEERGEWSGRVTGHDQVAACINLSLVNVKDKSAVRI